MLCVLDCEGLPCLLSPRLGSTTFNRVVEHCSTVRSCRPYEPSDAEAIGTARHPGRAGTGHCLMFAVRRDEIRSLVLSSAGSGGSPPRSCWERALLVVSRSDGSCSVCKSSEQPDTQVVPGSGTVPCRSRLGGPPDRLPDLTGRSSPRSCRERALPNAKSHNVSPTLVEHRGSNSRRRGHAASGTAHCQALTMWGEFKHV